MGTSCPFKKVKNDHKAKSFRSKKKPEHKRVYVKSWLLYHNNTSAGWDDVHLSRG
jgi:hypothetical protein